MKKELLISQESREIRVAILENNILEEFYIERPEALRLYGNIYKGKVKAIVPGIGASFINLGLEKDGFLYLDEDTVSTFDDVEEGFFGLPLFAKNKKVPHDDKLQDGQDVIVQVVKEPIRNKGPRLTRKISIPARYVVMIPGGKGLGISRRIEDKSERDRIRQIFSDLKVPNDAGFIVRTAGDGKSKAEYVRDIKHLLNKWKRIRSGITKMAAPFLIHQESNLIERIIRDNFTEDITTVVVDRKDMYNKVRQFIKTYLPKYKGKIEYVRGKTALFERYNIEKDIEKTFRRKVHLKCGGSIIIEQTEGLVAIDVNSGRFMSNKSLEDTAFRTNCEAAHEIARQMRLRDMGGIIIIDFIDMDKKDHRSKVFRILEEAVKRDRAKTNVLQISRLGLVEMTRQRMRPSLESAVYDMCPYCEGRGMVKSIITMTIKAIREIRKALSDKQRKKVEVKLNSKVAQRLLEYEKKTLKQIEKHSRSRIIIVPDAQMHVEDIVISI